MNRLGLVLALFLLVGGGAVALLPRDRPAAGTERIYLAGGCYWTVEGVFEHVKGVTAAVSGFATPVYDSTLRRATYAETVRIDYDPSRVNYGQLLEIFFIVAHDPTQVDRQGPDVGAQYRSLVFVNDSAQRREVDAFLDRLQGMQVYHGAVATELAALEKFTPASAEQQDYVARNPDAAYVRNHDLPKLRELERRYPALYH